MNDKFKDRLKKLEEAKLQAMAQLNALAGAIQECEYWITMLNTPPDEPAVADSPQG